MYNNPSSPMAAGIGSGALAYTGAGDFFWAALAGFALLATGMAITRMVPRSEVAVESSTDGTD
jgi:hypothetical protein